MKLKGIIFDVDGTIADTEEYHRQAFNRAFEEFELTWHWSPEAYRKILLISGGKERFRYCLKKDEELCQRIDDINQFINDLHQCKSEHYRTFLRNGAIQARPGIKRLVQEARNKNIQLGIATSSSTANFYTLVEQIFDASPEKIFNTIVTSDHVVDKKPSPAVYQCAISSLGLNADECVAIEDTENGNNAALNAGIKSIVTTHAYTIDNNFTDAALVLNHLGDIDMPFELQQGNAAGKTMVDIELLESIVINDATLSEISTISDPKPAVV